MRGFAGLPDGSEWVLDEHDAAAGDPEAAGRELARRMQLAGAGDVLRRAEESPHERHRPPRRRGSRRPRPVTVRAVELIAQADVILHDRLIPHEALAHAREAPSSSTSARKARARRSRRRPRTRSCSSTPARAGASCGSRAATRSCSAAAARRRSCCARPASRSRSSPASPPGSPRPPTPASPSPSASWPAASRSSPATRTRPSRSPSSTGRRSPRSPARSSSTWASARCRGSRSSSSGRPGGRRARRGRRARHAAGPAHAARHARGRRRARGGGGDQGPGDHARRPGRRAARGDRLARAAPAARPHDRRHARAGAGERPGRRLRELGAAVVEAPAIRIEPLARRQARPGPLRPRRDHLPERRRALLDLLRDARELAGITVAAIGPGTARALRERGIEPDVVPSGRSPRASWRRSRTCRSPRALIARAAEGRDVLPTPCASAARRSTSSRSTRPSPSRSRRPPAPPPPPPTTSRSPRPRRCASSRGGRRPDRPRLASIGPATSAALREHGTEPSRGRPAHARRPGRRAVIEAAGNRTRRRGMFTFWERHPRATPLERHLDCRPASSVYPPRRARQAPRALIPPACWP